jgi:hypothetical protein
MKQLPVLVRPAVRRLQRRLALGLVLDVYPLWAAASLLAAGVAAIVCRLFIPAAATYLRWLWLAPLAAAIPAIVVCLRRTYRIEDVVAFADSFAGGQGVLLTLFENSDERWADSSMADAATRFALPELRPWKRLAPLVATVAFLGAALYLPQRVPSQVRGVLADDIVANLNATLAELKQQQLVTAEEENRLEEEIERIRRGAEKGVDAASWEAADALREKVVAALAEKQDAVKWAEESLRRYGAASQNASGAPFEGRPEAAELTEALEKLSKSGLLAGAPPELQRLLKAGKLPTDPGALRELMDALSRHLAETGGRFGELAQLGREFGRFDPSEFPLGSEASVDGDGNPGRGGINRGRGDAELTWGEESLPLDRFKSQPLPPGAARSPDDWAPLVEAPGAPNTSPVLSGPGAARPYAASAGNTAWRRTLAPRHQSAVKKYFDAERREPPSTKK